MTGVLFDNQSRTVFDAAPAPGDDSPTGDHVEDITAQTAQEGAITSNARKYVRTAAKVALVVVSALLALKVVAAFFTATITAPFSLALTIPGIVLWGLLYEDSGNEIISRINKKIDSLI